MKIIPIKTKKITVKDNNLFKILDKSLIEIKEDSVLAITSKIISICDGRIVKVGEAEKDELILKESQFYLERSQNPYNVSLTITDNNLVASAGIDESNGNGYYVLWPKNSQQSANKIRKYLKEKFNLKNVGVIVTDSRTTPLRWGITAIAIAYSGIIPLKNYIGKPDIFGRKLLYTKMSVIDNLAAAAVLVMGEGNEQRPLAIIEEIPNIEFVLNDPSRKELDSLRISMDEDIYAPLLKSAPWKKGKK